MQLPNRIRTYLEQHQVAYGLVSHPPTGGLDEAARVADTSPAEVARAVLLEAGPGERLLVVLPATHLIDFAALREAFHQDYHPATPETRGTVFSDCEAGTVPPFGVPYGIPTALDESLCNRNEIRFEPGDHCCLLTMKGEDFESLHRDSRRLRLSLPLEVLAHRNPAEFSLPEQGHLGQVFADLQPRQDIIAAVERLQRLPAMPEMAHRLLRLRNDPDAGPADLAGVVGGDPSLTAQLVRYARSAFFGYRGHVDTLEQAITRVLGFEAALNIALGLAASRTLRNPADGPLGLQAFWRHAAYSAALAQALALPLSRQRPLRPGLAYLCGLLHNFGFLLEGHLFRAEFFLLNRTVAANPQIPVPLIETQILGMDHTELGGRLMSAWDMPPAVIASVRQHHDGPVEGPDADYVHLVRVTDGLLRMQHMGDGPIGGPPEEDLDALALDRAEALATLERLLEEDSGLEALAYQLAA